MPYTIYFETPNQRFICSRNNRQNSFALNCQKAQGYMWIAVGGKEAPYITDQFKMDRRHINAEELLKGYKGVVHLTNMAHMKHKHLENK